MEEDLSPCDKWIAKGVLKCICEVDYSDIPVWGRHECEKSSQIESINSD
jgi:hypothetical protein